MKFIFSMLSSVFLLSTTYSQSNLSITVKDKKTNESLIGVLAQIDSLKLNNTSDIDGSIVFLGLPNGKHVLSFSYLGFHHLDTSIYLNSNLSIEILLTEQENELDEVFINSTRTSRTIGNTPMRIEKIEWEEIDEKNNMRPANVSVLLRESVGILVQQTSATSANASIRVQGLDGRYTQLLKDGAPSFGNFASGLSVLEIPPLDLESVEVIKGPSSTLYGGGAIAGMVNFISKKPKEKPTYSFLFNASHLGQANFGTFITYKKNKIGFTILGLANYQKAFDVDKDHFTELPQVLDYTIHPKVFIYLKNKSTLVLGNSFTNSNRIGGDIKVIKLEADSNHVYFEKNNSKRNTTTFDAHIQLKNNTKIDIKNSFSYFDRSINIPNYAFKGKNYNNFLELSYQLQKKKHSLTFGANQIIDIFIENNNDRNFYTYTSGGFAEQTYDINKKIILQNGIRFDIVHYKNKIYNNTAFFALPKTAILFKINENWSTRIGAALGYKAPTIFTEATESMLYRNIKNLKSVEAERSYGTTYDISYKKQIADNVYFTINSMFFFTIIQKSTVLQLDSGNNYSFSNTNKNVFSLGLENNMKWVFFDDFKIYTGYSFTHAKANYLSENQTITLLPKHKLNMTIFYEKEDNFKIGIEGYFSSSQYLSNGTKTPSFWTFGFMAQKTFGIVSIYFNAENFSDTRQSRYKNVVNNSHTNPTFDEIWTNTEGFVISGGIKINF